MSNSAKTEYRKALKKEFRGIAFRLGCLLTLTALTMGQIIVVSELIDSGALSQDLVALRFPYALIGLLLGFLIVRELMTIGLYGMIATTGKHRAYVVLGGIVAVGFALVYHGTTGDMGAEYASAYTRITYAFAAVLGLEVAMHGTVRRRHLKRVQNAVGVLD